MNRFVKIKAREPVNNSVSRFTGLVLFRETEDIFLMENVKLLDKGLIYAYIEDSSGRLVSSLGPISQDYIVSIEFI